MGRDLVAVCDVCLEAIEDGAGVLEVDAAAADRALRAWRARSGDGPLALFNRTSGGPAVRWKTRHHGCGRAAVFAYSIAVERVRSWSGLLEWSVHLADKPFVAATDWYELVARALEPRRAAVSGILPVNPRDLRGGPVGDSPGEGASA
ncbi:hypothetical protein ACFWXK_10590 [Streptomyces sp. NPDC059070]|uniref:hypothetical protein n=1 Tax=Streptomyces sp. NPDC059070 TaxID=3346713 RepID=UPI00368BBBE6